MRSTTILTLFCAALAGPALAQGFNSPAELPPASFNGQQYIDSTGCAFVRAGMDGVTTWVPRLNRDRSPLCGFAPSFGAQVAAAPVEPPSVAAEGAPIATVAGTMAEPAPAAAPAPAPVAVTVAAPAAVAAPATPRVIAAPAPAAAPAPVAAAPRTITLAEACAGRYGPQPTMISSRTGQPIDCGPAPAVAVAVAPTYGCQSPVDAYFTGGTGVTPTCGPGYGGATYRNGLPDTGAPQGMNGGTGYGLQTAPGATVARGTHAPATGGLLAELLQPAPVPASNPVNAPPVAAPPPGYREAWDDGRINPDRGLPPGTIIIRAGETAPATLARAAVPEETAPVATSDRYVQVGTYADPANAQAAIARLQGLGLPVGISRLTRNGTEMQIVLAGPFGDAGALGQALSAARSAGFSDAYSRQ